jgi:hypothetical protein
MIAKILMAFVIVVVCFSVPSLVASPYTEIWDLLQDGLQSAGVIALMLYVVRGWTAILICIIEAFLIAVAIIYGLRFDDRETLYFAINYTALHQAAFALELAIIGIRTITGFREIGADYSRYIASHSVPFFDLRHIERDQ